MRKIGYLRVSTQEQRPDRQIEGLRDLCDELHVETLSAISKSRPVYAAVVDRLESGDCLIVLDLDRAYRSTIDALTEVEKLRQRGVGLRIANLDVDISTPAGIFMLTMLGGLAEFERRMLSQRTKEGLAAARLRGRRIGRPPKMDEDKLISARAKLAARTATVATLAKEHGVAPWTLSRALKRMETRNAPAAPDAR